jgi:putative lipoprotein
MRRYLWVVWLPALLFGQTRPDSLHQPLATPSGRDLWLAKDKADHLICSAFLTGLGYYASRQEMNRSHDSARSLGLGFSFTLGIAKEVYDRSGKKGHLSWKDLAADLLGCAVGWTLISAGQH